MAQGPGRTPRAAAKPGGGTRRRRTPAGGRGAGDRPVRSDRPAAPGPDTPDEVTPAGLIGAANRRVGLTTRAIALGVVFLLLAISYASSLRVFFDQQRQLAEVDAEIATRRQNITDLESELARWNDPAYVRAQARERLGWAVPGEVGYVVVGPDGKPIVPGAEIEAGTGGSDRRTWWQRLEGSVTTADQPAPTSPTAQPTAPPAPRTVAPSPTPSSTSTSR